MFANEIFKQRERERSSGGSGLTTSGARIEPAIRFVSERKLWIQGLGFLEKTLIAIGAVFLAFGDVLWKSVGAGLTVVGLAVAFLLSAVMSRQRQSEYFRAEKSARSFVDWIHQVLFLNHGDFRITLLLPVRKSGGEDFLRTFVRSGSLLETGRMLRIDETNQNLDGVAGRAWFTGSGEFRFHNEVPDFQSSTDLVTRYCNEMCVSREFFESPEKGRSPRMVCAYPLKIHGKKAGVLCIDAVQSVDLVGREHVSDYMGRVPNSRPNMQDHLHEGIFGLIGAACEAYSQSELNGLYSSVGINNDNS